MNTPLSVFRRLRHAVVPGLLALAVTAQPAQAQPGGKRLALLIANSSYTTLPPLDACRTSVNGFAAALKRAGFEVTEKINPSNGQMGAAISDFAEALARSPDTVAVAYACGHATAMDGRVFLLPASANLQRETDVLSQGIVSRLFTHAVLRSPARTGLILLDTVAAPGAAGPLPLASLVDPAALGGRGFAAVQTLGPFPAGTTELVAAATAAIAASGNDWRQVARTLRTRLPATAQRLVVVHEPAEDRPATAAATPAPAAGAGPAAAVAADGNAMTAADMRRAQLALQRLGYYSGKVDGVVGPDTLAAVRRFQHELRAEMTGQLTRDQVARLLKDSQ